ncbi:protein phosphatase 2C domain-containing protein [Nocardioides sp. NPDC006273]|uniref:protein phosphatase 2C domain-containing protein n=1 Tax=Nocardioides sp. NPDC006273 TaxID=3155598 RepID=UPI0033B47D1C
MTSTDTTADAFGLDARSYSEASPDHPVNEDFVLVGQNFAVVLDGASPVTGLDTGCIHDVPWLVRTLAGQLLVRLTTSDDSLGDILTDAIEGVNCAHASTCDLSNPNSPSSTVAMLRRRSQEIDYLVLADSPIAIQRNDGTVTAITDDRIDHLPDYSVAGISKLRNSPDGFWVASTRPEAGGMAVAGTLDLNDGGPVQQIRAAALLTDGAATLVERHGGEWADTMRLLEIGPRELIGHVRTVDESGTGKFRGKRHDDATAVLCMFPTNAYRAAKAD